MIGTETIIGLIVFAIFVMAIVLTVRSLDRNTAARNNLASQVAGATEPRECADHPGHYPRNGCPGTMCRFPHCLVDRRASAGSSPCTAERCTIQPFHSPCAYQTALAAKREAKRKPAIKPARKTAKRKA